MDTTKYAEECSAKLYELGWKHAYSQNPQSELFIKRIEIIKHFIDEAIQANRAETLVMPKIAEVHKNAEIMADPKSSDAEIYLAACRIAQIRIDEMARIYTEQVQEEVNKLSNFSA